MQKFIHCVQEKITDETRISKENVMYRYKINKIWYDDVEIIESEVPLSKTEIRNRIDECRLYCDEIDIEEEDDDE